MKCYLRELQIIWLLEAQQPEILDLLQDVIKDAASEQMYVDGQINLLSNYESDDLAKVKSLYQIN